MAEYTVLIIGDTDRWWTSMSMKERTEGYGQYAKFNEALAAGGHEIVGGAELTRTADARSIPKGGPAITEGPYTESVEAVGGYYQIRTDDLDGLMECCQIIAATGDGIEVRPNVDPADRPS